ncbi:capsule biosynthesis GfcC family protein [Halomonas alimentaria]|uniref:Capsule biosynthesis GfcC-like C-terminal domain-containing protein n=1 Tax=Halomonas alimentaria TaxID=147248 RepID=A0A7X4W805_9GAMM|nr:capsule biosynthesis GfcC family protein [Halomonas alimentaria]NAW34706.1 hypothetical protein [Halomonas alimentaria]
MVVATRTLAVCLAASWLLMPLGATAQQPEPQPSPHVRLSDAWLDTLQRSGERVVWTHAFALEHATVEAVEPQRRRLIAELETLRRRARLDGADGLIAALGAWQRELEASSAVPARTPGRHDLPWLGADRRRDPPLSAFHYWGHCAVPTWVEVWHLGGVSRLPWQPDMTLSQALDQIAGSAARQGAEHAALITPSGEQHRRGIMAWNHQETPLTPGSRVMLELPASIDSTARRLVNQRLPAYLATRLPGDECEIQEVTGAEE